VEEVGPYLSEAMGTVREDYSEGGDAWNSFTHDQAVPVPTAGRGRYCRISDDKQRLCSRWPCGTARSILKERSSASPTAKATTARREEYYFYLDSTPTTRT